MACTQARQPATFAKNLAISSHHKLALGTGEGAGSTNAASNMTSAHVTAHLWPPEGYCMSKLVQAWILHCGGLQHASG